MSTSHFLLVVFISLDYLLFLILDILVGRHKKSLFA